MQDLSITQKVSFSLKVLSYIGEDEDFDEVSKSIDAELKIAGHGLKKSEVFLFLKYICFFKIKLGEHVPHYFFNNTKEPIKLEIKDAITTALANHTQLEKIAVLSEQNDNAEKSNNLVEETQNKFIISNNDNLAEIEAFDQKHQDLMLTPIIGQGFSVRLINVLQGLDITYVGQILCIDHKNIASLPNVGRKTARELSHFLSLNGLSAFSLSGWPNNEVLSRLDWFQPGTEHQNNFEISYVDDLIEMETFDENDLKLMLTPIAKFDLSVRLTNVLNQLNLTYLGQILCIDYRNIATLSKVGRNTAQELMHFLDSHGLSKISLSGWPNEETLARLNRSYFSLKEITDSTSFGMLSDEVLELILCETKKFHFSTRLKGVLKRLKVFRIGQIILSDIQPRIKKTPNVGKQTFQEIDLFLKDHNLNEIRLSYWPSSEEIEYLIKERRLKLGRAQAIIIDDCETLEDEAVKLLYTIVDPIHQLAMFKRFGIIDDCMPWTLQEIGEQGFGLGPVTRERVRQIEARYLTRLKETLFIAKKCDEVGNFLTERPFVSSENLKEFIKKHGYSNALNPASLSIRLSELGLLKTSHKLLRISWLNSDFLVQKDCEKIFKTVLEKTRKELTGTIFVDLKKLLTKAIPEELQEPFLLTLKKVPGLFVYDKNDQTFVAKRAYRLAAHGTSKDGTRTNTLISVLTVIFSVCRSVNFEFLQKAILRDRKIKEVMSSELLRSYLESLDFIKIENNDVVCLERPKNLLKIRDHLLVEIALQYNSHFLDSSEIVQGLVARGLSSNSAGGLMVTSPLLVNLRKGNWRTKGQYRLICKIDDLDLIDSKHQDDNLTLEGPGHATFSIINNPPLRSTGRSVVPEMDIADGEYQVFDNDDNYLTDLKVKGKMIMGLKILAERSNGKNLVLSFLDSHFICE